MNDNPGKSPTGGKQHLAAGRRLYVGNIPYSMDAQRLVEVFAHYGFVAERPQVILDKETQQPKGFGFVELATPQLAEQAVALIDGQMVDGRAMRVAPANERPARTGGVSGGRDTGTHWDRDRGR
jgi:RNA recognition motif-containing protein